MKEGRKVGRKDYAKEGRKVGDEGEEGKEGRKEGR